MSSEPRRPRRRRQPPRADLLRLLAIGVLAAVMVGAARGVIAQDAPADQPPEVPVPAPPAPAPPPSTGSRPSVDVSADASVDFPGDI